METITESPESAIPVAEATPDTPPVAESSPAEKQGLTEMWQFSDYVHVGPGAEECEEAIDGSCANPLHFHAWCRLPNPFQNASIREKALAAKARKERQLRDPQADSYEILEAEMDRLRRIANEGDRGKTALVEDLLAQTLWKDSLTAMRELAEEDEWKTIAEDRERFQALNSMPADDRPADEYGELERHLKAYEDALNARREEEQKPQREALEAKSVDELIEQIKDSRIESEANEDFMRVFSLWEWYTGTMKCRDPERGFPTERVFGDVNHLQNAAPEVIEALDATFTELETAMGSKNAMGNS